MPNQNEAENIDHDKHILEQTFSMLHKSGLPEEFWPYAAKYAGRVQFVMPMRKKIGPFRTPLEAYYQRVVPFDRQVAGIVFIVAY